jgi:two-component system response regulator PrrA
MTSDAAEDAAQHAADGQARRVADHADDEDARAGCGLGDREQVGELRVQQPMVLVDRAQVHLGQHGVEHERETEERDRHHTGEALLAPKLGFAHCTATPAASNCLTSSEVRADAMKPWTGATPSSGWTMTAEPFGSTTVEARRLPHRVHLIGQDAHMADSGGSSPRVLVVDDDPDVLASLERGLRLSGFDVSTAVDGAEALRSATETRPDAIVLDINMPVLDGVSVVTALRAMDNDVPVCVLSARSSVDDRVAGLEAGADDYLVKPFVLQELVARVKALLRRRGATATFSSETIAVGPLEVDIPGRRARVNGVDVDLTKREFDLLAVLAEHKTAVLSRAQLLELVWGYDFAADTNVVDVFIGYLRRKLEAGGAPRLLHTVRGVGFVLRQQ